MTRVDGMITARLSGSMDFGHPVFFCGSREGSEGLSSCGSARELGGLARMAEHLFFPSHGSLEVFFFFFVHREFRLRGPGKGTK